MTGTLSGLNEAVLVRHMSVAEILHSAAGVNWPRAVDSILFTHLWCGGWSFLTVRAWMYHIFYAVIAIAAIGLVRQRHSTLFAAPAWIWIWFGFGQLYNV
jgi:hypothetical protein